MIICPKGAIVTKDELQMFRCYITIAIDRVKVDIDSNRVHNPRFRTAADRELEKAWKADLVRLNTLLRSLDRVLKGEKR